MVVGGWGVMPGERIEKREKEVWRKDECSVVERWGVKGEKSVQNGWRNVQTEGRTRK